MQDTFSYDSFTMNSTHEQWSSQSLSGQFYFAVIIGQHDGQDVINNLGKEQEF